MVVGSGGWWWVVVGGGGWLCILVEPIVYIFQFGLHFTLHSTILVIFPCFVKFMFGQYFIH